VSENPALNEVSPTHRPPDGPPDGPTPPAPAFPAPTPPAARRKFNLAELQRDLEQVAPVEMADFESLADAVSNLLNRDTPTVGRIEKQALWERVELEIERIEADGT
jgi:hypothetical protein